MTYPAALRPNPMSRGPARPFVLARLLLFCTLPLRTLPLCTLPLCTLLVGTLLGPAAYAQRHASPGAHASTPSGSQSSSQAAAHVSGAAIYQLTRELLAVAPKRFNGSPGHAAAEKFLQARFEPEIRDHRFEQDSFTASTPAGYQTMHNYIVKYPGKKDGIIVLGSHYETNYPLKDIAFFGANDGACTSALLIEIGRYLRTHPPQGYSVWLVFFDGEEAVKQWSAQDSLYGSRHLAARWSQDGTLPHIKAFLLADMIGDKHLDIDHDANSNPQLWQMLRTAATDTGHLNALSSDNTAIEDDTVPFAQRGVPVLDIIDYDYGPHDAAHPDGWHHTADDTIDKIGAQSLQTSADLFLQMIRLIDQH